MKISTLINYLETIAPPSYQEKYDNSGLLVGLPNSELKGVLLCLDSTEAVLDEAIKKGCNLVIAHHPIVFKGLKRFNGRNYVERVVMKAIKNDIAIYAAHTNLDNVYHGVNAKICQVLGLKNTAILSPKSMLKKLVTYVPVGATEKVRTTLLSVDPEMIGIGKPVTFGVLGVESQAEGSEGRVKMEIRYQAASERPLIDAIRSVHPDAAPVIETVSMEANHPQIGAGMIGELDKPMAEKDFLLKLKKDMKTGCVKYTALLGRKIKRVAVCGGSGSFLLSAAKRRNADVFVTSDYKYHEFFDAENKLIIADIGHYESEQYTIQLLNELITKKFSTFAVHLTEVNTNPVNYL